MIAEPATFADWLDMLAARGQTLARGADLAVLHQIHLYPSWALRPAAGVPPVALAGTVHATHSVIWLRTAPAASRLMVPLIRILRGLVEREAALIGRPLWAEVDDDNEAGRRIVALLGFARVGRNTWRRDMGSVVKNLFGDRKGTEDYVREASAERAKEQSAKDAKKDAEDEAQRKQDAEDRAAEKKKQAEQEAEQAKEKQAEEKKRAAQEEADKIRRAARATGGRRGLLVSNEGVGSGGLSSYLGGGS